jgi:hypothetical protein
VRFLLLSLMAVWGFSFSQALAAVIEGSPPETGGSVVGEGELPVPRLSMPAVFRPERMTVRGQSPSTFETPAIVAPSNGPVLPYSGATGRDPFLYGPDPVLGAPGAPVLSGVNGPQPYREYTTRFDYTWLAESGSRNPDVGHFESHSFDVEMSHSVPLAPGWIFTSTPQAGVRLWEGPDLVDLPESVFRLGWDFTLAMPLAGPWSVQLDFNPSINTDFGGNLTSDAWNFDGNVMFFYRTSPQWMLVLGAGYWDRVDNIVVPYAGVVWNPNDLWELRLLFPKSRISYFLGNFGDAANWLYVTGEYHVESYQIEMPGASPREQVQLQDWRIGLGLRSDHQYYEKYFEVGYVLGRQVDFRHGTPGFDLKDTFMARFGIRF